MREGDYRSLYVSLKCNDEQQTLFSNKSFRDIMDYLNEEKFIMLYDLVDGLYLPCALKNG
ncbi:hypothetical protein BwiPL1_54840 (plasmid) [Bacillus wiedmannii]|nr:hypothetical protein BwiPL1_54840 [Bacillus wiedmannii]